MTPRQALQVRIAAEFEHFIEFPTETEQTYVTSISAKLFTEYMIEKEGFGCEALRQAYLAGFARSSEGFNGEYGADNDQAQARLNDLADKWIVERSRK